MKQFLFLAASVILFTKAFSQSNPDNYLIMENYYKIKWGHTSEFIDLWKKNHYPLLKKTQQSGDIISVKAEVPVLHSSEDSRWDFKVTIVWKNAQIAIGKEDPTLNIRHSSILILKNWTRMNNTDFHY